MSSSRATKKTERECIVSNKDVESLIDRVTRGVLDRLDEAVKEAVDKHVKQAVSEIRSALEDRLKTVEETCKDIITAIEFRDGEQQEELKCLRAKVLQLEHADYQRKHEANVVISGLDENLSKADENCKALITDFCKERLGLELQDDDIVEAVRLGRSKQNGKDQERVRPRSILVKTKSKLVKSKIIACRGPRLRNSGVYLNEDLSRPEQNTRRALVPIYKKLREKNVKCHFDRACLVVGDRQYFDPLQAKELLTKNPTELVKDRDQLSRSQPAFPQ